VKFSSSQLARVNPSHYGSDEQVFGAEQQGLHGGQSD